MSAHTPGPWKASKTYRKEDEYWYSFTVNAEHQVAKVYGRTITDAQVDARLIAAAPRMLKALQNLIANQYGAESVKAICYSEARAILRDVEGESNGR